MWKYLAALLVVLLSLGGVVTAIDCDGICYANMITQTDTQTIQNVRLGTETGINTVAVGNEGLSAAIIVTKPPVEPVAGGAMFVQAPFARIDQVMTQTVSNLGPEFAAGAEGAKGITWNKAIQAAWMANQGVKEIEGVDQYNNPIYAKEGSYIGQNTTQLINNTYDYTTREGAKILNVDNKLAMIVDNMSAILNLQANADSSTTNSESVLAEFNDLGSINLKGNNTS